LHEVGVCCVLVLALVLVLVLALVLVLVLVFVRCHPPQGSHSWLRTPHPQSFSPNGAKGARVASAIANASIHSRECKRKRMLAKVRP